MSQSTSWEDRQRDRRLANVGKRRHLQAATRPVGTVRAHPIMSAQRVALRLLKIGTVVLCDFPFTDADESKYRPGIVVSKTCHSVVVLPITSSPRATYYGDLDLFDLESAGLEKQSTVRLAKRRTLDRNDIVEVLGHLGEVDLVRVFPTYEAA